MRSLSGRFSGKPETITTAPARYSDVTADAVCSFTHTAKTPHSKRPRSKAAARSASRATIIAVRWALLEYLFAESDLVHLVDGHDVDGDAVFPLRAQTVGQVCEIERAGGSRASNTSRGLQLIFVDAA